MDFKYLRKIATLIFISAALLLIPANSISASADEKLPAGSLSIAPNVENLGIIEITDEEAKELEEASVLNGFATPTGDHYRYLSADEKLLYRALYNAITQKKYIPYSTNISSNDYRDYKQYEYVFETSKTKTGFDSNFDYYLNHARQALYYDHPDRIEFFMCWPRWTYAYGHTNGTTTEISFCFILRSWYDDTRFEKLDNEIRQGLKNYLEYIRSNGLVSSWSAVTELNVYNYYSDSIDYDWDCASDSSLAGTYNLSHTAWGSLASPDRKAVCDGYSAGFEMIMDSLNIDSMVIAGLSKGGGHAWNIVKLDGRWYEVDTTWASGHDTDEHIRWFNRTTAEFSSMNPQHMRTTGNALSGFRMPLAYGTHYTYDYLSSTPEAALEHDDYVEVTGISITETTKDIMTGDTFTLDPVVTPGNAVNKSYFFETDDESIVALSGNSFTAVDVGTTTVRVVTSENRLCAECVVNVSPRPKNKGESISVKVGSYKNTFKVTSAEERTVSFTKSGNKNATSLEIPSTITDENDISYTVTEIDSNALKNYKKLKKLTIPVTVRKIGKNALRNATKLKSLKVYGNNLISVKSGAFTGVNGNCKITIYCRDKKTYNKLVKLFKKAGAKKQKYAFKKKK
jgi:uncharacterized protein YjdB